MNSPIYITKQELAAKGYFSSLNTVVRCHCGECPNLGNSYMCELCARSVPYCFGADDEFFEFCDDCANQQRLAKPFLEIAA